MEQGGGWNASARSWAWVALVALGLILLGHPARATARRGHGVIQGHVVLRKRAYPDNQEIGEYELMRMHGEMSSEDSVAWLKSMTPGAEIVWVDRTSKGLQLQVDVASRSDTLKATVVGDCPIQIPNGTSFDDLRRIPAPPEVRSFAAMVPDTGGVCHLKWDLRSSAKKKVGPGLYGLVLTAGEITKVFYIVMSGTP